jgi:hypothetical protein
MGLYVGHSPGQNIDIARESFVLSRLFVVLRQNFTGAESWTSTPASSAREEIEADDEVP